MRLKHLLFLAVLVVLALLALPALAFAAVDPPPSPTLTLPTDQIWTFVAGNLVMLVAYVLNHVGPWVSEPAKGVVVLITTSVAGALTQAITAGNVGFNGTTLQFVVTAVLGGLMAHAWFWQRSGIAERFGAGSNA